MAGYSGTPLTQKLGIKAGAHVAVLGAPAGFLDTLDLPAGVTLRTRVGGQPCNVILSFTLSRAELEATLPALRALLVPDGGLWVAWPKRSSGVASDLTEDAIREVALANRLVDNKVCAIDETWSGLRLVIRLADRPKKRSD
jgi:hypothetical protein